MSTQPAGRPLALITGASSGLGAAFAERFAREGFDLVLVARRRQRLQDLGQRLAQAHGTVAEMIPADLAEPRELAAIEERMKELPNLARLVNNAGFGAYMPFVNLDPAKATELISVQVTALTRLTRAALPAMMARGEGAVINVSSRLAFTGPLPAPPLPHRATYTDTKAFVNTFTQILAAELQGTGVRVQALCPGVIATEFHERVGADPAAFPPSIVMSPEDVVQASLAGLAQGEVVCVPGLEDTRLLAQLDEAQKRLWDGSRSGTLARRYRELEK